jgi:hypothetical protein
MECALGGLIRCDRGASYRQGNVFLRFELGGVNGLGIYVERCARTVFTEALPVWVSGVLPGEVVRDQRGPASRIHNVRPSGVATRSAAFPNYP